ncbi:MAG: hypothetical protein ACLFVU_06450 [Phycisphaerae bacterium]
MTESQQQAQYGEVETVGIDGQPARPYAVVPMIPWEETHGPEGKGGGFWRTEWS